MLPDVSGRIEFEVESDYPVMICSGGTLLVDSIGFPGKKVFQMDLQRGKSLSIYLFYNHPKGREAYLRLRWREDNNTWSPIPDCWLKHSERHQRWVERSVLLR